MLLGIASIASLNRFQSLQVFLCLSNYTSNFALIQIQGKETGLFFSSEAALILPRTSLKRSSKAQYLHRLWLRIQSLAKRPRLSKLLTLSPRKSEADQVSHYTLCSSHFTRVTECSDRYRYQSQWPRRSYGSSNYIQEPITAGPRRPVHQ